jgi:two-component system sensor histidine kinase BarA
MDIFDEKLALEKVEGNRELMLELFSMMVNELPKNMAELESALQHGDKDERWNIAHKLTGSTAYCGVPALQASTRALENSIRNDLDDVATHFARVQQDVQAVIRYHQENLL